MIKLGSATIRRLGYRPVTLTVRPVGDHLQPQHFQWSLVVFKKLPTIVRWSLAILVGFWAIANLSATSRWLVANGRMMVLRGQRKVVVVFSSRRPIVLATHKETQRLYALHKVLVFYLCNLTFRKI